eukprot:m.310066 g.310066  ORF g.310066 m.310066 type:complete len:368 (+) comp49400_c0_seq1:698-1801(+)
MLLRLFAIALGLCVDGTLSIWWSIVDAPKGPVGSAPCKNYGGTTPLQEEFCRDEPEIMEEIRGGADNALRRCAEDFNDERWNCDRVSALGPMVNRASKETGFLHAITTAGVMLSVIKACTRGSLNDCNCTRGGNSPASAASAAAGLTTTCPESVAYARQVAELFIDTGEDSRNANGRVNRHNNLAGREAVESLMTETCKCYGLSGSCSFKSCYLTVPSMEAVGLRLREKYNDPKRVHMHEPGSQMKLKVRGTGKEPAPQDIVFMQESPNFCKLDKDLLIKGVANRQCNVSSIGPGSCSYLCCGHGYEEKKEIKKDCSCKFKWCCYVVCEPCEVTRHYCRGKPRRRRNKPYRIRSGKRARKAKTEEKS